MSIRQAADMAALAENTWQLPYESHKAMHSMIHIIQSHLDPPTLETRPAYNRRMICELLMRTMPAEFMDMTDGMFPTRAEMRRYIEDHARDTRVMGIKRDIRDATDFVSSLESKRQKISTPSPTGSFVQTYAPLVKK